MDIKEVMNELDQLFQEENVAKIGPFLEKKIEQALQEENQEALLVLYNELMGFYREIGQYDQSIEASLKALDLAKKMQLADTIPYATTLLNAANAHRAAGLLKESRDFYMQVFPVYDKNLSPDDMLFANLYNNISLLDQEIGDFTSAKENLLKAFAIVSTKKDASFELAVTYANLANTCIVLKQLAQAKEYANKAIQIFEENKIEDVHYSAALSALGNIYYKEAQNITDLETIEKQKKRNLLDQALAYMQKSADCIAKNFGTDNLQYRRVMENMEEVKNSMASDDKEKTTIQYKVGNKKEESTDNEIKNMTGMSLCKAYYETYGNDMIVTNFPDYKDKIAVGLVGKGSDCFGFDDEQSRDHDFGPRFCMWVTKETYDEIGEPLQKKYEELPTEFMGIRRIETFHGRDRAGVFIIEDFYKNILGVDLQEQESEQAWLSIPEYALAAAVNGAVFVDQEGIFSAYREKLLEYYPTDVWYRKLAQSCALFSQNGQYNLPRMAKRGQAVAAKIAQAETAKQAMYLTYLLLRKYCPHDKWLYKGLEEVSTGKMSYEIQQNEYTSNRPTIGGIAMQDKEQGILALLQKLVQADLAQATGIIEEMATMFADELSMQNIVSKSDVYLDANTQELLVKSDALLAADEIHATKEELIDRLSLAIAKAEFEAFDKVQNEGGRASCQNNWPTFRIMRMSQYKTWSEEMLLQYLYDFKTAYAKGQNMIEEKYARMMASTAPQKYAKFEEFLPTITPEKHAIIEEVVRIQVAWMEAFAEQYPGLADNARYIHTSEDTPFDTSYETYLRGELGTYSDKMLELYGRYIVEHAQTNRSVAEEIMNQTIHYYGYQTFEEAMAKQS